MSSATKRPALTAFIPALPWFRNGSGSCPKKTGRSLEEWLALTRNSGPPTEKERREWLKKEHKLGTNSAASWIAERLDGKGTEEDSPGSLPENRRRMGGGAVLRFARRASSVV